MAYRATHSFRRFVFGCVGAALVVGAVLPAGALADATLNAAGPSASADATLVAPFEAGDEPGAAVAQGDSAASATEDASDAMSQADAASSVPGGLEVSEPEEPQASEAPQASEQPSVPEVSAVIQAAPAAPSEWTASVKLSASGVSAGTEVVVTPQVSGVAQEGFTYNYVWQRDGWADWGSTVKETGHGTQDASYSFYPTKPGSYTLMVDVTDVYGTTKTVSSATLQVTAPAWTASAKADKSSVQVNGNVGVTVSPSTSSEFSYNYVWERDGWKAWDSTVRATGSTVSSPSWSFTPTVAGTYNLYVDVVDPHGASVTVSAGQVKVAEPAWNASLSLSQGDVRTGQQVTLTPSVSGIDTTGFTYNYVWNYEGAWAEWGSTVQSSGSATSEPSHALTFYKAGTYELYVDAISPSGTRHTAAASVKVAEPGWRAAAAVSSAAVTQGDSVTLTPTVSGAQAEEGFTYNYVWSYGNWSEWDSTVRRTGSYTADASYTFTPAKSGTYMLAIDVKDAYGAVRTVTAEVKVTHDFTFSGVGASTNLVRKGGSVVVRPQVSGNTSGLTYNYVWMKDNWSKWGSTISQTGSATSDTSWTFTPSEPGNYTVFVDVIGTDGVSETLSCDVAVWDLLGLKASASGNNWTLKPDLGISNAEAFGFKYNYVYNQAGAWSNWSSTVRQTGAMTTATSATFALTSPGRYDLYVDVASPSGETATASKSVVTYAGAELDMWGRINSLSSPTNYLIACDVDNCVVGVYEKRSGDWVQIKRWSCTTGAWSTPTRRGLYSIESKGQSFDSFGVRCFWYSGYSGPYLFHSICYWPNGAVQDGRLGMHLSHGCIRLDTLNAKWIYDNVPYGTTVYVY